MKKSCSATATPDSFNSERTSYIADAFYQTHQYQSTHNGEPNNKRPLTLRSLFTKRCVSYHVESDPIKVERFSTFRNGDYAEGVFDLTLDVFEFYGAGAAAKGAKAMMSRRFRTQQAAPRR